VPPTTVVVVATDAEPQADKRDDPDAIPLVPIAIPRRAIPRRRVSIARAIIFIIVIVIVVIVAATKAVLLGRPILTFSLTGPGLHVLN
jgi:hypothetical protein